MSQPFSLDAERGLVARLLIDPSQLSGLRLDPDDLHDPASRATFEAMQSLAERNVRIDAITVQQEAGRDLDLDVMQLTVAHHAPLSTYAEVIAKDAWRRRYLARTDALHNRAQAEDDVDVLLTDLRTVAIEMEEEANLLAADPGASFGVVDLEAHRQPPPAPLLSVLSPDGTTILYGDGGDGKGWVASKWAAELTRRGIKVAIIDFEQHPGEWAYRLGQFGIRPDEVVYVEPSSTLDKWATDRAARFLRSQNVEFLMIDSAMYASNVDDPYSPSGALAYGRARRNLDNLPALLLAHTSGGVDKVFGSVYWRNESRLVWRLNKDSNRQRYLEGRKANNYPDLEGKKLIVEFDEERGILNLHEHGKPWSPQREDDF